MIRQIEGFQPVLERTLFAETEAARERGVDNNRARAVQNIAPGVAESVSAGRNDDEGAAIEPAVGRRIVNRAFSDAVGTGGLAIGEIHSGDAWSERLTCRN